MRVSLVLLSGMLVKEDRKDWNWPDLEGEEEEEEEEVVLTGLLVVDVYPT